jgi:protein TonB
MDFSDHGPERSKRIISISVVIALHVLVFYAMIQGLGKQIISVLRDLPIETTLISEQVKPLAPPTPKPNEPRKVFVPKQKVDVARAVTTEATEDIRHEPAVTETTAQHPVASVSKQGPAVVHAVVDFSTCAKPDYPRSALRNEEQGTVRIQFLIGVDGRVADSKIAKSSGYRALDTAAKNALGVCRFKPGTINGVPQQSWTTVDYVWKLPD